MKAQLSRLVCSKDSLMTELHDRTSSEVKLFQEMPAFFKIKLIDMSGPLKIQFSFDENKGARQFTAFFSNTHSEPGPGKSTLSHHDPNKLVFASDRTDKKSGRKGFHDDWLFIAVHPKVELELKIIIFFS